MTNKNRNKINSEVAILNSFVWSRFKTKKEIALKYKDLVEEFFEVKNIQIINSENDIKEEDIDKISFITIPVDKTRYEDEAEMDFNLIFTLNIADWSFIDIDLYYLKDNAWQYYITEYWYEYQ